MGSTVPVQKRGQALPLASCQQTVVLGFSDQCGVAKHPLPAPNVGTVGFVAELGEEARQISGLEGVRIVG